MHIISQQIESSPDKFMRRSWLPPLNEVRTSVAGIICAEVEEVVIVPSATHGINTILHNPIRDEGDIILMSEPSSSTSWETYQNVPA